MPGRPTLDPYAVLGVARDATPLQVARAHRHLAKAHHPDLHEGAAEAAGRMRNINEAWAILSNPARRAEYDGSHPSSGMPSARPLGRVPLTDSARLAVINAHLGDVAGHRGRDPGRASHRSSTGRDSDPANAAPTTAGAAGAELPGLGLGRRASPAR